MFASLYLKITQNAKKYQLVLIVGRVVDFLHYICGAIYMRNIK